MVWGNAWGVALLFAFVVGCERAPVESSSAPATGRDAGPQPSAATEDDPNALRESDSVGAGGESDTADAGGESNPASSDIDTEPGAHASDDDLAGPPAEAAEVTSDEHPDAASSSMSPPEPAPPPTAPEPQPLTDAGSPTTPPQLDPEPTPLPDSGASTAEHEPSEELVEWLRALQCSPQSWTADEQTGACELEVRCSTRAEGALFSMDHAVETSCTRGSPTESTLCTSSTHRMVTFTTGRSMLDACFIEAIAIEAWGELPQDQMTCEARGSESDELSCSAQYDCFADVEIGAGPVTLHTYEAVRCDAEGDASRCTCFRDPGFEHWFRQLPSGDACELEYSSCVLGDVSYTGPLDCGTLSFEASYYDPPGELPEYANECTLISNCRQPGEVADQLLERRIAARADCFSATCTCDTAVTSSPIPAPDPGCYATVEPCVGDLEIPWLGSPPTVDETIYPATTLAQCLDFDPQVVPLAVQDAQCRDRMTAECPTGSHRDFSPDAPCPVCAADTEDNRIADWGAACYIPFLEAVARSSGAAFCMTDADCDAYTLDSILCSARPTLALNHWLKDDIQRIARDFHSDNCRQVDNDAPELPEPQSAACVNNECTLQ